MQKFILITADTNDGDYISNVSPISDEEIELFRPIIEVINNYPRGHNWPNSEYDDESPEEIYEGLLTIEQIELMEEYVPYGEYGIHTVVSIEIIQKLEKLM